MKSSVLINFLFFEKISFSKILIEIEIRQFEIYNYFVVTNKRTSINTFRIFLGFFGHPFPVRTFFIKYSIPNFYITTTSPNPESWN